MVQRCQLQADRQRVVSCQAFETSRVYMCVTQSVTARSQTQHKDSRKLLVTATLHHKEIHPAIAIAATDMQHEQSRHSNNACRATCPKPTLLCPLTNRPCSAPTTQSATSQHPAFSRQHNECIRQEDAYVHAQHALSQQHNSLVCGIWLRKCHTAWSMLVGNAPAV